MELNLQSLQIGKYLAISNVCFELCTDFFCTHKFDPSSSMFINSLSLSPPAYLFSLGNRGFHFHVCPIASAQKSNPKIWRRGFFCVSRLNNNNKKRNQRPVFSSHLFFLSLTFFFVLVRRLSSNVGTSLISVARAKSRPDSSYMPVEPRYVCVW